MKKATRQQTRAHNKRLVLRTIYQEQGISRADVARATHLTRTTISHIVAELIAEGLIESLKSRGFEVLLPSLVPVNDGGISLGQIYAIGGKE